MHTKPSTTSCLAVRACEPANCAGFGVRDRRGASLQASAGLLCAVLLLSCAHTNPAGQALVAIGALTLGFGALDAAGVLGSDCRTSAPTGGEAVSSCGGDGIVPQEVDILSIGIGAGLVAAGVVLWTQDSPAASSNTSAFEREGRQVVEAQTPSAQHGALFALGSPLHVAELHRCSIPRRELPQGSLGICAIASQPPELKQVSAVHR